MIDAKIQGLLLLPDGSPCQVYDRFHAIFRGGESLEVTILEGQPPAGKAIAETQMELPEGYTLFLSGNKKGFLLKRLSSAQHAAAAVEVAQYRLDLADDGHITALEQTGTLSAAHIWGTGERYHAVDMKGSVSSGAVTEKFTQQGEQAYLPIPFFFTEQGVGCCRESNLPVQMDFRDGFTLRQQTAGSVLAHDFWFFGTPSSILARFIWHTGQPVLPPEWAFGVWISANGWDGDAEVDAQLSALKQYDYPADVMVLEAWSDERTFYRWNDAEHWADPEKAVRRIKDAGLHLVLWQIPVIKQMRDGEPGEQLLRDEREAIEKKYCIFKEDGTPYRIPEGVWFNGSLLPDFTNPETVAWWFGKRRYLLDMGVEGFKTDGGEFLLDDTAHLHNGMRGREAHNLYPSQYIGCLSRFYETKRCGGRYLQPGGLYRRADPAHSLGGRPAEPVERAPGAAERGHHRRTERRAVLELRYRRLRRRTAHRRAVSSRHGPGVLLPHHAVACGAPKRPVLRHPRGRLRQRPQPLESGGKAARSLCSHDRHKIRKAARNAPALSDAGSGLLRESLPPPDGASLPGLAGRRNGLRLRRSVYAGKKPADLPHPGGRANLPPGMAAPGRMEALVHGRNVPRRNLA
jgi:hypothetical protein